MPDFEVANDPAVSQRGPGVLPQPARPRTWSRGFGVPLPMLLALLAAGAGLVLRIDGLDRKSLWGDELFTAHRIALPTLDAVIEDLNNSPFPPVYYALLWTWSRIWGFGDASLRSLAATLGILTLPATYLVWRPIVGHRAAAWTIVLLALNAGHINYSQDAKMYSAVWLLAVIASGSLLNAVMSVGSTQLKWLALFGIATAISPLISFVGVVPIGVQAAFGLILIRWRPERRGAVLDAAVVVVLAVLPSILLALPLAVERTTTGKGIDWIPSLSITQVPRELYRYLDVLSFGYRSSSESPGGLLPELLDWILIPCTAVVVGLLVLTLVPIDRRSTLNLSRWRRDKPNPIPSEVVAYLALWFLLPVAITMATSLVGRPFWGVPRYLFGSAPALTIWLGLALSRLKRTPAFCLAMALLTPNLACITFDRTYCTRTPWRQLATSLASSAAALSLEKDFRPTAIVSENSVLEDDDATLVIVSLPGRTFNRDGLIHAWRHSATAPTRIQPAFIDIEEALIKGRPFVVIMVLYMGATSPDAMRGKVEQAIGPTWRCRPIFKEQVFEEPYTAMPTPYMRHSVEAWICLPNPTRPAK